MRTILTCFILIFANTQALAPKAIIFDMDGVLRRGFVAIDGAAPLIHWMSEQNIQGMILTNECRFAVPTLRQDLRRMGINLPKSWPIYTSANAVQEFLETKVPCKGSLFVFVVGEAGLKSAVSHVEREGFHFCSELPPLRDSDDELIVVFGAVDKIQIDDLEQASQWINNGAKVITTCPDIADPSAKGSTLIGMPSHLVHMIKMHAPCTPYCLGKPHSFMIQRAIQTLNMAPSEMLFVGDSIDTDIRLAFEAEIPSALVLTGNTREEQLKTQIIQPNYVFKDLNALLEELKKEKS